MPHLAHTTTDSPVGLLTLVAVDGALTGLYMDRQKYRPETETFGDRDHATFAQAIEQLEEYFAGRLTEFDLPLAFVGTPFQRLVWEALRQVPYGQTVTYGNTGEQGIVRLERIGIKRHTLHVDPSQERWVKVGDVFSLPRRDRGDFRARMAQQQFDQLDSRIAGTAENRDLYRVHGLSTDEWRSQ